MDSPLQSALNFYTSLRFARLKPNSIQLIINNMGPLEKSVLSTLNQKEIKKGRVISGPNSIPLELGVLYTDQVWPYGLTGLANYEPPNYTNKDLGLN